MLIAGNRINKRLAKPPTTKLSEIAPRPQNIVIDLTANPTNLETIFIPKTLIF